MILLCGGAASHFLYTRGSAKSHINFKIGHIEAQDQVHQNLGTLGLGKCTVSYNIGGVMVGSKRQKAKHMNQPSYSAGINASKYETSNPFGRKNIFQNLSLMQTLVSVQVSLKRFTENCLKSLPDMSMQFSLVNGISVML